MTIEKKQDIKVKSKDWYEDQYSVILIQRNFLILFGILISIGMLITLILIKNMNDNSSIEPFIIEYDKNTGITTIVETKSKKEYLANEAVKESLFVEYIKNREEINLATIDEKMNYIRVTSNEQVYNDFIQNFNTIVTELRSQGINARYFIEISTIKYLSNNRVEILFKRSLISNDKKINEIYIKSILVFNFLDLEMNIDDMRLNPLGFQVSFYKSVIEKDAEIRNE